MWKTCPNENKWFILKNNVFISGVYSYFQHTKVAFNLNKWKKQNCICWTLSKKKNIYFTFLWFFLILFLRISRKHFTLNEKFVLSVDFLSFIFCLFVLTIFFTLSTFSPFGFVAIFHLNGNLLTVCWSVFNFICQWIEISMKIAFSERVTQESLKIRKKL